MCTRGSRTPHENELATAVCFPDLNYFLKNHKKNQDIIWETSKLWDN